MHSSPRLGLSIVDATDDVSGFPIVHAENMTVLDGSVMYSEGTISARPAAAVKGRVYRGTDTGLLYEDNGSVWQTVMLAGAWVALNLTGGFTAWSADAPAARLVGDRVELRGVIESGSGSSQWATLPSSAMYPANAKYLPAVSEASSTFFQPSIGSTGAILSVALGAMATLIPGAGAFMSLDGLSYTLS